MEIDKVLIEKIIQEWKDYELSESDDLSIEECGVQIHRIRPKFVDQILGPGYEVIEVVVCISWGIVQHKDWGVSNVLIPIHGDGYCFKAYDLEGKIFELNNPDVGEPIIFNPSEDHSLAPTRKPERPFMALNVDYVRKTV